MLVFVGTYTGGKSQGIYTCELDTATGALKQLDVTGEVKNPSFLAIHPSKRFLYSVSEVGDYSDTGSGAITAFTLDSQGGRLKMLNHQSSTSGGPCHLVVDRAGKNVLVANYGGATAAVLPIGADGKLAPASSTVRHAGSSVDRSRQEAPHPHSINLDPAGRFAFVADLGLDKVLVYRFDSENGTLAANDPPSVSVAPGSGPRHFAFHPSGKFAYVINEMKSTVTAFNYDAGRGVLTILATEVPDTVSTLPGGFTSENTTAEVQVHPTGNFLYASNRGHDSIAIFAIDPTDGSLTGLGHEPTGGRTPRNFGIDPDGKFLLAANQDSGTITVFRIDRQTGRLASTGQSIEIPMPVCVKFVKREQ
jgi:6-phosphogluconolactonase